MAVSQSVMEKMLLCKSLIQPIRYIQTVKPTNFQIAKHVLISHAAAELAISAIAEQIGCQLPSNNIYLMDYFGEVKNALKKDITGRDYFDACVKSRFLQKTLQVIVK